MIFNTRLINIINELHHEGFAWKEMFVETPFFQGDISLRKANLLFEWTEEEINEYTKCSQDIIYFANKYVITTTEDGSVKHLSLRNYQIDYLNLISKPTNSSGQTFVANLCARQMGTTLLHTIQILHDAMFKTDKNTLICSNTREASEEIVQKIKSIYVNLPFWLKPGVKSWNQVSIIFDNGCKIKTASRSKNAAIGYTIDYLYMVDAAFLPENIFKPFYDALYPITAARQNTKFIISSTPNGMNLFHSIYTDALGGVNKFKPNRIDYWLIPNRDEKWKEKTIKDIGGIDEFEQEYELKFKESTNQKIKTLEEKIDELTNNSTIEELLNEDGSSVKFKLPSLPDLLKRIEKLEANIELLMEINMPMSGDFFKAQKVLENPGQVTWEDVQAYRSRVEDWKQFGGTFSNPLS